MRLSLRALAGAILVLGPTALAFFSGGFFDRPRLVAGIAVWVLVAFAVLVGSRPLPRRLPSWVALGGLALLAAWTGLSYEWAPLSERAQGDAQRLLLYLGTFVAGVALFRGPLARRAVEPGLAAGTVLVSAYGLADRLLPGLFTFEHSPSAQGRLEQPLTYWNAMGCLSAMGLVLCVGLAADPRRHRAIRAGAALASPTLGLAIYLSFSRGALLAVAAGLGVLLLMAPSRRHQGMIATVLVAGGAVLAAVASLLPQVESLPAAQQGDTQQGLIMLAALVVVSLVCAAMAARRSPAAEPDRRKRRPRAAPALVAVILVVGIAAGLAGVAALEQTPDSKSSGLATASRFGSTDTLRYAYWGVALDAFAHDPLAGTGSGGFAVEWRRQEDRPEPAVDAHSLYVETLAELGLVGAAALLLFMAGVVWATARLYRREPAAAVGPAAALVVWAVHAGLDWDWEMPALTGISLLLAASLVAWQDEA